MEGGWRGGRRGVERGAERGGQGRWKGCDRDGEMIDMERGVERCGESVGGVREGWR